MLITWCETAELQCLQEALLTTVLPEAVRFSIETAGRWGWRTGESTPTVKKPWFSLQVANRVICMWATSAPRGPHPVSSEANVRRQWQISDGRTASFHVSTDTKRRCLDSTSTILPDPLFLYPFLSIWMWVCPVGIAVYQSSPLKKRHDTRPCWSLHLLINCTQFRIYRSLYGRNAHRRTTITRVFYRIYASIHPLWHSPVRTGDREVANKTTARTAIGMSKEAFRVKNQEMLLPPCLWWSEKRADAPERLPTQRRFLKLCHHLTCLDVATKSRTAILLKCKSRETTAKWAGWHSRHSPFSSAFYVTYFPASAEKNKVKAGGPREVN